MDDCSRKTKGLFITGTDTDVGKTYVTCMIARQLVRRGVSVGAYKPACSGAEIDDSGAVVWRDVVELSKAIGGCDLSRISPQCFRAPLAPPVAAKLEGTSVDSKLLRTGAQWWHGRVDLLLIEGVGGLLCPMTESETVADLAADFGFPLIIVGRLGLGTINHTLLTVEAAQHRGLAVAGIILNAGDSPVAEAQAKTNPAELAARCQIPLLGVLGRHQKSLSRDGHSVDIDWLSLASEGTVMSGPDKIVAD